MKNIFGAGILLAFLFAASTARGVPTPVGPIPADRLTAWNPGIPGGVPARTSIYTTLNASTYGSGSSDATAGIQAALDACPVGKVVVLSAGDFKITQPLSIDRGVVLRGQGPSQTKLKMPVGTNANLITIGTQWFAFTQPTNLAADALKGATSATLVSNPGLAVGELVIVDTLTNSAITQWSPNSPPGDPSRGWFCRTDRPLGQALEVQSISGNTITFTTPFHIDFKTSFGAQLSRIAQWTNGPLAPTVKYAGVEDLYVSGGSQGQGNIWLNNAAYCWVKNVESDYQDGKSVAFTTSFRCVLRDSYVHSTQNPNPGGGGYGVAVSMYAADNLIENNIVWNMNKVMVMQASGGGNVIGYNCMEDGWISYATGWVESGLNASHMTTAHFELFEGNEAFNFDGECTWGNAVYITAFRNHLTGKRRSVAPLNLSDSGNRKAAGIGKGHWWYSIVGNVLGSPGQTAAPAASFVYEDFLPWSSDPAPMWRLGYDTENWNAAADPKVLSTLIRGGNFDYVTNLVHWESIPSQPLPDSLYLPGKPGFFGTLPWPWVDPVGGTKLYTLPARLRFDGGSPPPALPTVTVAATDTSASEAGLGQGKFTITRTGATTNALTVHVGLGGTATAADYAPIAATLTIPTGSASATVTVTPVDDTTAEGSETVVLTIAADAAYSVGNPASATVTIADNDAAPPPPSSGGSGGGGGSGGCGLIGAEVLGVLGLSLWLRRKRGER